MKNKLYKQNKLLISLKAVKISFSKCFKLNELIKLLSFEFGKVGTIFANIRGIRTKIAKLVNFSEKYKNCFIRGINCKY